MNSKPENTDFKIMMECIGCGLCAEGCELLSEAGETPVEMAIRGIELTEAFSCFLCGRCEAACPLNLRPVEMFAARRAEAMKNGEVDPWEQGCFLPDEDDNIMALYRKFYDIDYSDLKGDKESDTAFFPGCTLLTYSPGLVREAYRHIQHKSGCQGILTNCCGKPLDQLGLSERAEKAHQSLIDALEQKNIKKLVVACPGCYYHLRELLSDRVELVSIYEVIDIGDKSLKDAVVCTIHDSCPDRFEGIFGSQVRNALRSCGYSLVEMTCNGEDSPCCGSGGQISHFRPDLVQNLINHRLEDADSTNAEILAAYCLSCVLNLANKPSRFKVRHALNLLLDYDEDYSEIKDRVAKMFDGPNE
jgi:Fe-S oxidoreductase